MGAIVSRNSVEKSDNIITGRGMGVSIDFALKIAEQFVDKDKVDDVAVGIIYR